MSRFRRLVHSVASGYLVLAAAAAYALGSVPLALHYLSKEQFGLWALMASISGYLSLIDLGMSGSVARLLIDHKDRPEDGIYGGMIKTGWLVLLVQGAIVFFAGSILAVPLCHLLRIQTDLQHDFVLMLRWQSASLALSFITRIFGHLLQAHQRLDISNYSQIAMMAANFGLQWQFFHAGQGVFSLVWAGLAASCGGALVWLVACWRLHLLPPAGAWGRASWLHFKELFAYGKDMFLVAVGTQFILASQTLIVTRCLGLEAATAWNVGTRAFNLVNQAIWRIADFSAPALSEMVVRGEYTRLRERYRALVILTASLSGSAAVMFALCNSPFVAVLTHGKVLWPPVNDLLLGVWMVILAVLHCHVALVLLIKRIGFMRYIYVIEGLIFAGSALLLAKPGGIPTLIACSIVCSIAFSSSYGVRRSSRYFGVRWTEVGWEWLAPMRRVLVLFSSAALMIWVGSRHVESPLLRLICNGAAGGSVGAYLCLRYGLSQGFQQELVHRSPRRITPLLRRIMGSPAQ